MSPAGLPPDPWRRRGRRLVAQWRSLLVLAALWVLLWGDLSWANVIAGLVLGALVVVVLPLPSVDRGGTLRPWPLLVLVGRFVADLVVASFQVAWTALRFGHTPRSGVVGVRMRSASDVFLTVTAELSSLVPGSLVVEAKRSTATLYLHVLDLEASGGPDAVRAKTLALEARVLRAFADRAELERAGLGRGRGPGGDRGRGRGGDLGRDSGLGRAAGRGAGAGAEAGAGGGAR